MTRLQHILSAALAPAALVVLTPASEAQIIISQKITLHFGIEATVAGKQQLDIEHTDIQVGYKGDGTFHANINFGLALNSDSGGTIYQPDAAYFYANSHTRNTVPEDVAENFAFTGAGAGETLWVMPQSYDQTRLYLGFNTKNTDTTDMLLWNPEEPGKGADYLSQWVEVELAAIRGPAGGDFALYQNSGLGAPTVFMASADGIDENDSVYFFPGGHNHFNWSFSEQGTYEIDFVIKTYVVPEPGAAFLSMGSLMFLAFARRRGLRAGRRRN